jgi:hypothetical protein
MPKRSEAIRRILGVEQQLRRAAEARLSELRQKELNLETQRRELLAWLNGETPPPPGLAGAATGRLVRLDAAIDAARREVEAQQRVLLARHGREKRVERLADSLERTENQEREKRLLQEILEAHARTSLP